MGANMVKLRTAPAYKEQLVTRDTNKKLCRGSAKRTKKDNRSNLITKEFYVPMVGLDGAGKTTILYKMKGLKVSHIIPTVGVNVESLQHKNIGYTVWDFTGKEQLRPIWKYFYRKTKGIIYVVDSTDHERIDVARQELEKQLEEDELRDAVLIVFANKQDKPNAMSASQITEKLQLRNIKDHPWYVQTTSAVTGYGLDEGMTWLSIRLENNSF